MLRIISYPVIVRFFVAISFGFLVVPVSSFSAAAQSSTAASGKLVSSSNELWFLAVTPGTAATLKFVVTNRGATPVVIAKITATTPFSVIGSKLPLKLAANQSASVFVHFSPRVAQHFDGTVTLQSNSTPKNFVLPVHGTGVSGRRAAVSPTALNFGNIQIGSTKSAPITLSNTGIYDLVLYTAQILGGSDFYVTGLNLPLTIAPAHSVTFNVVFAPFKSSYAAVDLSLINNHSAKTISLSGTGTPVGNLTTSPAALSFGTVAVGTNRSATATLIASDASLTVASATSSSNEFALSGLTLPLTIAAGQTKNYTVTFKPGASGAASGNIVFVTAGGKRASQALTGSGSAAVPHSVSLSWNRPTSSVSGYNVYRGETSGGPYSRINTSLDASALFLDNAVVAGQTYFYVVTTVDAAGAESVHSAEALVAIPAP